jgi:hypothetical protein
MLMMPDWIAIISGAITGIAISWILWTVASNSNDCDDDDTPPPSTNIDVKRQKRKVYELNKN